MSDVMATDEEVERVANAIFEADLNAGAGGVDYKGSARAAITALRAMDREKHDALMSQPEVRGFDSPTGT